MRDFHIDPSKPPEHSTFSVSDLVATIRRNKVLIIVATLIGAAAGVGVATRITDSYTTSASIIWDTSVSRIVEDGTGESSSLIDPSAISTIVETLTSPAVIERAIQQLPPDTYAKLMTDSGIAEYLATAMEPGVTEREKPLMMKYVEQNASIFNSGRSYVVYIYYKAADPKTAEVVANAVADAYLAYRVDLRRAQYSQMLTSLGDQIRELRTHLSTSDSTAQSKREEGRLLALRSEALTGQMQQAAVADSAALFSSQREAERRADAAATVYEKLLRNQRELESRMATPELNVHLFAPAVEPLDPSGFNPRPILPVLGTIGGFLFATSLSLVRERFRGRPARKA